MLEVRGFVKRFGSRTVLDHLDAVVDEGRVTALVGPNGSGKSTLLKALWGEAPADSGKLLWRGEPIDARSTAWKRQVGAVPDDDALIEGLSIGGHFALCGGLSGLSPATVEDRSERLVRLFALEDAMATTRMADEASRGNRKRLACALALLGEPELLLMDEPFSGLDAERAAALTSILRALASRGLTILLSCHDDGITRRVADRFLLLRDGKAVTGQIGELPRGPATVPDTEDLLPWLG
ncbi:MAG TPA: ABC transporter ATP-binding protein [Spirochaetales bacterium]|nr:ABC transporter ATP-binding protein [Spirochaetales bacterium]HPG85956.1 ABC transporter ATP-binding protein [Spirochaetales bacterium]